MLTLLSCFFLSALLSFAGSLQPGPVNMIVLSSTLNSGKRAGMLTALGGALPEFFYSFMAVAGGSFIMHSLSVYPTVKFISPLLLIFTAIHLWFIKISSSTSEKYNKTGFLRGLLAGLSNPLLIIFWWMVWSEFVLYLTPGTGAIIAFACGSLAGAFLLLSLIVHLGHHYHKVLNPNLQLFIIRGMSFVCLFLSAIQIIRLAAE